MGSLWDLYGISMGSLWDLHGFSMGLSLGSLWDLHGFSMGSLGDLYENSILDLSYRIIMLLLLKREMSRILVYDFLRNFSFTTK